MVELKSKVQRRDHNFMPLFHEGEDKILHLFLFVTAENTGCVYCKGESRWQNRADAVEATLLTVYHFCF